MAASPPGSPDIDLRVTLKLGRAALTLGPGETGRALVLDLDVLLADGVAHRLRLALNVLAQADFLGHPRRLRDDGFLATLDRLDRALLEGSFAGRQLAIDRPAVDRHMLLAKLDLLLHRALGHVAAHPHAAAPDLALADPKLLLDHLQPLVLAAAGLGPWRSCVAAAAVLAQTRLLGDGIGGTASRSDQAGRADRQPAGRGRPGRRGRTAFPTLGPPLGAARV